MRFANPSPPSGWVEDFHFQAAEHAQHTAKGNPTHGEYSAKFDGKDYPWKGNPNADTISLKRIDDYAREAVTKKDGKVTITGKGVVSRDGKTLTIASTGKDAQGQDLNNTQVFEKQ